MLRLFTFWCLGSNSTLWWFKEGVALPKSLNSGIRKRFESFRFNEYGFPLLLLSIRNDLVEVYYLPKLKRELYKLHRLTLFSMGSTMLITFLGFCCIIWSKAYVSLAEGNYWLTYLLYLRERSLLCRLSHQLCGHPKSVNFLLWAGLSAPMLKSFCLIVCRYQFAQTHC